MRNSPYSSVLAMLVATFCCFTLGPAQTPPTITASSSNGRIALPPEKSVPVNIGKITTPPVIDGRVTEDMWNTAAVFKDFYQTSPGDNTAASKPTEVRMAYDEKHLYIAFKCWDEKDKIRATVAKRDNVFGEDNVRVWLDTYNDQRRAYVLGFNPFGVQQDGIFTEGRGADFSVDIVMESKGVIEEWGWSVEVAIPFKSLRYSAGKGKMWGFNVARNIDRLNDEFDQWLPDDRNVSGLLIKHGKITGLDEIKYERTLEIAPSITLSETGSRVSAVEPGFPAGRFVNQPIKNQLGVTLKYTLSPNVTLDAAINPDFAEIEADARVVTANQRFPIFFPEKRPFFLEAAEIFNTPLAIYNSRSIVDPDLALKLTGKIDKNSFGIMIASDNALGNYDEDSRTRLAQCIERRRINPTVICSTGIDEFLDKNSLVGVARVKRDFGAENNIGFFATYRAFPEQKNFLASVDTRIKLNPRLVFQGQVVGTTSRRCFQDKDLEPILDPAQGALNRSICGTGTFNQNLAITDPALFSLGSTFNEYRTGNGLGYYLNIDYSEDRRGWVAEMGGRTSDFRADVGFTRRTDTNFAFFYNRLSTKSNPKATVIRANFGQFTGIDFDWKGRIQNWRGGANVNFNLARSMFGFAEFSTGYEKLYEEEFGLRRRPTRLGQFAGEATRSTWRQGFFAELGQNVNRYFRYSIFGGSNTNSYDYFATSLVPNLPGNTPGNVSRQDPTPGRSVQVGGFVEFKPITALTTSINYNKSRLTRNSDSVRSFDSDIVSFRSTYQFTRFIFTRARIDYDSLAKNYSGQILLGWAPSPGRAFYAGYEDNLNRDTFNPFNGQFEPGFARNGRKFFVRASYLFRKSF